MPPPLSAVCSAVGRSRSSALAVLLLLASCQYAKDRSLDFLDQYRVVVGVGSVGGVRARGAGLVDTGLMFGVKPHAAALGWRYGKPFYFDAADGRMDADQAEIIKVTSIVDLDYSNGSYKSARNSLAVLPALFTWTDSTPKDLEWYVPEGADEWNDRHWLWSDQGFRQDRWAQIHAFDIEVGIGLFGYAEVGYSPGELVDFLLGLFLIDIARDDGRF